jgi:nuclease S1
MQPQSHRPQARRHLAATLLAMSLVLCATASPAWAWGKLGHRVISRLAKKHMTEKARDALAELLAPGETIADASTWADDYRREHRETAPWHYVDVPLDEPRYDAKWSADDPKKGCVVEKIKEFMATVEDKTKPVEERRFALRFLIHCIEDMHQPCHVGDNHDRGGNDTQVQFFDRGTNMHALWDGGLLERMSREEDYWLRELTALPMSQAPENSAAGTVEAWATESLLAAREAYVDPATGLRIKSGAKLGLDYHNKNMPVAKERMYRAAMRLARVLNECLE